MATRKLRPVGPEEETRRGTIRARAQLTGPLAKGSGHTDWVCPTCGTVIFKGYDPTSKVKLLTNYQCRCGTVSTMEPPLN